MDKSAIIVFIDPKKVRLHV